MRDQAGALVVLGDDLRARGERRLDPRLDLAGRARPPSCASRPAPIITDGFDVFVQLVIAAITTWPWSSVGLGAVRERDRRRRSTCGRRPGRRRCPSPPAGARRASRARRGGSEAGKDSSTGSSSPSGSGRKPSSAIRNDAFDSVSATRSCGRLGPASDGTTSPRSSSSVSRVRRRLRVLVVPEALLLRVRLDERDLLRRAAGELEVAQRLGVDREDRARRAVLGAHVADRRAVGQRQVRHARAEELDELADDAVLAQHLRDGQHEVGRGRALGQLAVEAEADHLRDQHRHRLAEHRRLGLDAADAPAEHAEAVDHRRVRVGADERVGVQHAVALEHHAREVLEVDLVHDAGVRRHDLEALEGVLAPAQERVALLVALELALGVDAERVARAEVVDLHRVVDDQLGRDERVDLRSGRRRARPSRRASRRGRRRPARR